MSETQDPQQNSNDAQRSEEQSQPDNDVNGQNQDSFRTTPTIRPTLVWIAITILGLIAAVAVITANQEALGGQNTAEIAVQIVAILGILIIIRLGIRIFILTRTEYLINEEYVRRKYSLLMRTKEREVPISVIRSGQLEQNRIQYILGYGNIKLNEDLGAIRLDNIRDPHDIQSLISDHRIEEANSEGTPSSDESPSQ